jgi:tetratricopeptide (TPR) repeat protein
MNLSQPNVEHLQEYITTCKAESFHISGNYQKAIELWKEILNSNNSDELSFKIGVSCLSSRQKTEGFYWLEKCSKHYREENSKYYYNIALYFYYEKKYELALSSLDKIQKGYKNQDALILKGLIAFVNNDIASAKKFFSDTLDIKNNDLACYNLGLIHRKLGDLNTSEIFFTKALKMYSSNPKLYYFLSTTSDVDNYKFHYKHLTTVYNKKRIPFKKTKNKKETITTINEKSFCKVCFIETNKYIKYTSEVSKSSFILKSNFYQPQTIFLKKKFYKETKNGFIIPIKSKYPLERIKKLYHYVFERWKKLIPSLIAPTSLPKIVIVKDSNSFCYVNDRFIRISSALWDNDSFNDYLLLHEFSHLIWGIQVKFDDYHNIFLEALTEYVYFLAENDGRFNNYKKNANKMLLSNNIISNAPRTFKDNRRTKMAFVLENYKQLVGNDKFTMFINKLYTLGSKWPLSEFDIISIASDIYGENLNWFFSQWIETNSNINVKCSNIVINNKEITITVENETNILLGVDIEIMFCGAKEKNATFKVNSNLHKCRYNFFLDFIPEKIIIDPQYKILLNNTNREFFL